MRSRLRSSTVKSSSRHSSATSQLAAPLLLLPGVRGMGPLAHIIALTRCTSESCLRNLESVNTSSKQQRESTSAHTAASERSPSVRLRSLASSGSAAGSASM